RIHRGRPDEAPPTTAQVLAQGHRLWAGRDLHQLLSLEQPASRPGRVSSHVAGEAAELFDQRVVAAGVVYRGVDLRPGAHAAGIVHQPRGVARTKAGDEGGVKAAESGSKAL